MPHEVPRDGLDYAHLGVVLELTHWLNRAALFGDGLRLVFAAAGPESFIRSLMGAHLHLKLGGDMVEKSFAIVQRVHGAPPEGERGQR